MNAAIDGVDPGSANPIERFKFVVYQRRMLAEALKTKASLYAMLGEGEKASAAAKEYFDVAFPVAKEDAAVVAARREESLKQLEQAGPLRMINGKLASSSAGSTRSFSSP